MYREFTEAEKAQLVGLIKSPEYKRMVDKETQHFRMAWLEKQLNPESKFYLIYLLRATWESYKNPLRRERYKRLYMTAAEAEPNQPENLDWLEMQVRIANFYREEGSFDKAQAILSDIPIDQLSIGLPLNEEAMWQSDDTVQKRWFLVRDVRQIGEFLRRRDAAIEPIDIWPSIEFQAEECYFRDNKTAFEIKYCSNQDIRAFINTEKDFLESLRETRGYDGPLSPPPPPPKRPVYHSR